MLIQIGQYASSHKRKTIFVALLLSFFASCSFDYAHADNSSTSLTSGGIYLATFIAAGVLWSLSGFINNIRNHANYDRAHPNGPADPDWKGFQAAAMRDDVFIGLILGVVAFILNGTNAAPTINSVQTFLTALVASYGLIGLTDKIGVGAILNR